MRARRAARSSALFAAADGDCGEQCILGRRRIRRIALEHNLAVAAMQESVAPAFSCLSREG
jgi:hypothetical protein